MRRSRPRIAAVISKAILAKAGLRVPVVVRTASDLLRLTSSNPFIERGADTDKLHVVFLADRPAAAQAALLDPARSPPDEFLVRGAGDLPSLPGRCRSQQADQCLLRLQARHGEHRP